MRVSLFGSKDVDSIEFHLADSFKFLGHDVFHLDVVDLLPVKYRYFYWGTKVFPKLDTYIFTKAAKRIAESNPDLIICTYRFIHPSCIYAIKKLLPNIPVVQINPDALTTFEQQQIFASPYDFYFTKDPYMVSFMKVKMGLNAFYLPESFNQRFHIRPLLSKKEAEEQTKIDVLSFGTMYPYRTNMLKKLVGAGLNITMFGTKDRFFPSDLKPYYKNEFITGERKAQLLFGSKIIFNNFHYAEIDSVNCKFFEIAGCEGFQICDYRRTIDEYSIIPSSTFAYTSIDDAIDKIRFFLSNDDLRYELSHKQYNHFLKNHTYDHRVKQLLEITQ